MKVLLIMNVVQTGVIISLYRQVQCYKSFFKKCSDEIKRF